LIANPPGARADLSAGAAASLAAAAVAAAIRAVTPFEHGIWLVAYLFLVGFLAQLLLGRGQAALLGSADRRRPPPSLRRRELLLWNAGVVAVPLGVLVEARLFVVAGAAALLGALISFSRSVAPALANRAGGPLASPRLRRAPRLHGCERRRRDRPGMGPGAAMSGC
jgi:hypothetical protein